MLIAPDLAGFNKFGINNLCLLVYFSSRGDTEGLIALWQERIISFFLFHMKQTQFLCIIGSVSSLAVDYGADTAAWLSPSFT